jgi:hypothetical protein
MVLTQWAANDLFLDKEASLNSPDVDAVYGFVI